MAGVIATARNASLEVGWTAETGSAPVSYKVQWKSGAQNNWDDIDRQVVTTKNSTTLTGLTNNTQYTIRVAATTAGGDGDWSSDATGTPAAVALTASTVEDDTATLSIANHTGSWYYKYTVPTGGTCTEVSSGTTASLSSLTPGTSYTYKAYSDSTCGTELTSSSTDAEFLTKPAQVSGVTVTALSGSLKVTWTAVTSATGYTVQWKSTGEYGSTDQATPTGTSHTIPSLMNGTQYSIRVAATNATGDGDWSSDATGTPAAVTLTASTVEDDTATLSIANHTGSWYYKYTVPTGGTCTEVSSGTTASLSSLTPGTSYTFKAYRDSTCGTELTSATTDAEFLTKPAQVSGVTVTALSGSLKVTWTAVTSATGYKVQWKSAGEYGSTNQATPTGTSHTIPSLTNGTQYSIRVAATNATGDGDWSSDATGTPVAVALTASTVEDDTATLSIANHTGSWYYKYTVPTGGTCTEVSSGTTASLSSLTPGTSYTYKAYSDSSCNNELTTATTDADFLTKPAQVSGVTVTPLSGSLKVSWTAVTSATGYTVQWKSTGEYGSTNQATPTGTSHTIPSLTNGTQYSIRVAATNGTGDGDWSSDATETPVYSGWETTPPSSLTFYVGETVSVTLPRWGCSGDDKKYGDSRYYLNTSPSFNFTNTGIPAGLTFVDGQDNVTNSRLLSGSPTSAQTSTTYYYHVLNSGCGNTTDKATISISVLAARAPLAPSKPSGVAGHQRVTLSWQAGSNGGSAITGWEYAYKTTGNYGAWTPMTSSGASTTSYTVTGLTNSTAYTFKVRAVNTQGNGDESPESDAVTPVTTVPAAPAKPTAKLISGSNTSVTLEWTAPDNGGSAITGYKYKKKQGKSSFETTWTTIPNSASLSSYTVTGLTPAAMYRFKVLAVNANGDGAESPESDPVLPGVPLLTASLVEDDTATLSIASHTGTWYYKKTVPSTPAGVCTEVSSGTTASLSSLTPGTSYTYKAYSDSTCGTELTSATTDADFLTKPAQVTGLAVKSLNRGLSVSWTAVTGTITGYKVQWKSSSDSDWDAANRETTVASGTTSATVTSLTNGTAYTVRLMAYNTTGNGAASTEGSGTPGPVSLTSSEVEDDTAKLTLSNHVTSWYYKSNESNASCTKVSAGTSTASLSSLTPGTSYTFKAYSDSTCGTELTSATTDADFLTKPAQVSGVTVTPLNGSLKVTWTAATGTVTGYKVQWKSDGEYDSTNQATPTGTSHTIPSLTNGTQYSIRVAATNATGDGDWSSDATGTPAAVTLTASTVEDDTATLSIANHTGSWYYKYTVPTGGTCTEVSSGTTASLSSLTPGTSYTYKAYSDSTCGTELTSSSTDAEFLTKPAQVSGVTVTALSGSLKVTWTAVTSATGYTVQWKSTGEYGSTDQATPSSTSHTIPSLTNGTQYSIRVAATNATGDGDWSSDATGTPAAVALTASTVEDDTATLSIANHTGSWYYKYTTPSGGTCTEVSSGTTASLSSLTPGTSYTYKAYSDSTCGTELTTATTDADFLTKPAQVSGVTVTPLSGSLKVTWTAATVTVTGYKVQWKSSGEYSSTNQATATGTSYTIPSLTNGTSYSIRVAATNTTGDGDWSSDATGTPAVPPTLTASAVEDDTATLTISNHVAAWYYKYTVPSGDTSCTEVSAGTSTASLSSLTPGTSYTYKAYSDSSCNTELTSATTDADFLTKPAQVSGVTVTPLSGSLKVTWTAATGTVTGYKVQWKSSGEYSSTNQATPTGTSHTIGSLTNGTSYSIRVAATNTTGDGDWSSDATGTPVAAIVSLAASVVEDDTATLTISNHTAAWYYKYTAPSGDTSCTEVSAGTSTASLTGLTAGTSYTYKAYSDSSCNTELTSATTDAEFLTKPAQVTGVTVTPLSGSLKMTWTAATGTVTGYKVQWKSNGEYGSTNQATPTGTSHTIGSLTNGTSYSIRVAATNTTGDGDWSSDATGTPAAVALTASAVEDDTATLTISNHVAAWYYKYTVPSGDTSCTEVSAGTSTASLSSLTPGTSYTYKAYSDSSCNTELTSATTDADFLTKPAQVSGVTVTPLSDSLKVRWTAVTSATGYKVQWKSNGEYGSTNQATPTGTSHTIASLTNGTQYSIRVAATNATGDGDWSSDATGTPGAVSLTVSEVGSTTATLTITNRRGSWYYKYTKPTPEGICREVSSGTTVSLSGLLSGTRYVYKAYGDNSCRIELTTTTTDAEFLTKPSQVSGVTLTTDNGSLDVSWTAVSGATGYKVQWKSGGGNYSSENQATSVGTSYRIGNLSNETEYSIRVAARNVTGDGVWSSTATASPTAATLPGTVTTLSVTPGDGQATLSWSAPSNGGAPITDYDYEYRPKEGHGWREYEKDTTSATTSKTISGLSNGEEYRFRVRAVNKKGSGPYSWPPVKAVIGVSSPAVPTAVPDPVTTLRVTPGNGRATLSWSAPNDGGSPITDYDYEYRPRIGHGWREYDKETTSTATSKTVTGLSNGKEYRFRVRAVNVNGEGNYSWPFVEVKIGLPPSQAATPSVVAGPGQVSLTSSVSEDNGSAVTKWQVLKKEGEKDWETTWQDVEDSGGNSLSATVRGLSNNPYRFKVRALNGHGVGAASSPSAAVTPSVAPTLSSSSVTAVSAVLTIRQRARPCGPQR